MEVLSKLITFLVSLTNVFELLLKLLDAIEPLWTRLFVFLEEAMWFLSHVGMYYSRFRSGWFILPKDMIDVPGTDDVIVVNGAAVTVCDQVAPSFKLGTYRPRIMLACMHQDLLIAMKNGRTRRVKR